MRTQIIIGLIVLGAATPLSAQEIVWKAAKPAPAAASVTLGKPTPMPTSTAEAQPSATQTFVPRIIRAQGPPPPPPYPGFGGGAPVSPVPAGNPYDFGVVNNDADLGGFWSRFCDGFKRSWNDVVGGVPGAFQPGPNRAMFQSDRCFEVFASPVSNPFYFEDPRALTEVRPLFIWQRTPSANTAWAGGDNYAVALRGSVAFTPNISVVVNRLGWSWIDPNGAVPGISADNGFSEVHIGPKITFIRNETSNTVAAFGVTFEIPSGSSSVLQDTGSLSIAPYFSIAQNFWRTDYGSLNFMNTTGYVFRTDGQRSESIYSSFHLDYDVRNLKRIYPLIEMNFRHYTRNGDARDLDFEGNDLGNFGSRSVSGLSELTMAVGGRFVINNNVQFGIVGEFNLLSNGGGRHLDRFRLTTDFIFRY